MEEMSIDHIEAVVADLGLAPERKGDRVLIRRELTTVTLWWEGPVCRSSATTSTTVSAAEEGEARRFASWYNGTATWPRAMVKVGDGEVFVYGDDWQDMSGLTGHLPAFIDRAVANGEGLATILAWAKDENWNYKDAEFDDD